MHRTAALPILIVVVCIVLAGCLHSPAGSAMPVAVPATTVSRPVPETPAIPEMTTSVPREAITVVRYVPQIRDLRAPALLFAVQAPAGWNVTTWRLTRSDLAEYRTDLVADGVFAIYSYPGSRSREQAYRDGFRQWSPAPAETAVTINGIPYERFESRSGGNTTVAYLMDTNGANERGYASVLVFTARDANRFELEDFETVISSFRYYPRDSAATISGSDIPLYDLSGTKVIGRETVQNTRMFDSSDWDGGGSASDGVSSGQESPGSSSSGGSSSGGGCHH
jgi:uncharacterized membrane protein YgcG